MERRSYHYDDNRFIRIFYYYCYCYYVTQRSPLRNDIFCKHYFRALIFIASPSPRECHLFLSFSFESILDDVARSTFVHSSVIVRPLPSPTDAPRSLEFASRRKFIQKKEHAFRNRCEIIDVRSSLPRVSPNKSIPLSGRKQIKKKREKGRERKKNSQWNTNEKRKKGDKNSAVLGQTETLCGNHRGE